MTYEERGGVATPPLSEYSFGVYETQEPVAQRLTKVSGRRVISCPPLRMTRKY